MHEENPQKIEDEYKKLSNVNFSINILYKNGKPLI